MVLLGGNDILMSQQTAEYQKDYMAHLSFFPLRIPLPLPGAHFLPKIPGHRLWPAANFSSVGGRAGKSFPSRANCLLRGGPTEPARLHDPCSS